MHEDHVYIGEPHMVALIEDAFRHDELFMPTHVKEEVVRAALTLRFVFQYTASDCALALL